MGEDRPLFAGDRRRRGRNERAVDGVAKAMRAGDVYDEVAAARVTLGRTLAASLDRLEVNHQRSEHTVGSVGRVLRDVYVDLAAHLATGDDLGALFAALDAAAGDEQR